VPDFPFPLMIFAAGFGTRMGALTADRPKPLIPVAGVPLIDHALAVATAAGVQRVVVNTHYKADQIAAHLAGSGVRISHEAGPILETGGGLRQALPLLGSGSVAILNSDGIFAGANPLTQLARAWDGTRMDALLLLLPVPAPGVKGDFRLASDGRISRGAGGEDHLYIGASLLNPDCLGGRAGEAFSLNRPWNDIIAAGRGFGIVHQGGWCDVGRPEGITAAEALLQAQAESTAHG
jgi:MurNAc alpha-1-phosphate uridylyltransferase